MNVVCLRAWRAGQGALSIHIARSGRWRTLFAIAGARRGKEPIIPRRGARAVGIVLCRSAKAGTTLAFLRGLEP